MVLYQSLLNFVVTCQTSIISNKNECNFVEKQSLKKAQEKGKIYIRATF